MKVRVCGGKAAKSRQTNDKTMLVFMAGIGKGDVGREFLSKGEESAWARREKMCVQKNDWERLGKSES